MTDPGGGYVRRLHVEFIVLLAIITVVFAYLGWNWRPQSSGFPAIPQGLTIQVPGSNVIGREVLTRTGDDGAVLEVFIHADAVPENPNWNEDSWSVTIFGLGAGRVCTPRKFSDASTSAAYTAVLLPQTVTRGAQGETVVESRDFRLRVGPESLDAAYLRLCWDSDAPVQLNGSYLGARFPPLAGFAPLTLGTPTADTNATVARTLRPDAETHDFAIQSQPRPTSAAPDSWDWASQSSEQPIQLAAIDVSDTQHADYLTFLSGIAFGLAGAAAIALLGEFILPLHRRRQDREDRA